MPTGSQSSGPRDTPLRWLAIAVLGGALALPTLADTAPAAPTPVVDPDFGLPDGDQTWAAALAALEAAIGEDAALAALFDVVNLLRRRGDYAEGIVRGQAALERARAAADVPRQIDFLYLLGRIYWSLTDYPRSLELHFEELRLATELDDPYRLARTHGGLAITYQRYGREAESLHHIQLGLTHAARAPDQRMRASLLNSLGNHHLARQEYARAIELYNESLQLREAAQNQRAVAETLTNLGLAADGQGDHGVALDYLRRALTTFEALRYRRYIANTHRRLGRVLRHAGQFDESLAELDLAREVALSVDSIEVLTDIWLEYALTHEAAGRPALALDYQRRHANAASAARNAEDRRRMDELRARYEKEQSELEIDLLRQQQQLQSAEIDLRRSHNIALAAGLIGGLSLLGALCILQVMRLRSAHRLHQASEHARQRAENAEKLKTRLLQMASHDLKVPLSALHATAGSIARAATDPVAVRRHAAAIRADTERMRHLVRDFLDASAVEDGHLTLHPATVDLVAAARDLLPSLRPLATSRRQRLTVIEPAAPLPCVRADPARLRQVFENLIGNALTATPDRGSVSLTFGHSADWAFAEVRDEGPGLGPAEFARIFASEPSRPTLPDPGSASTGLGLFIVRELLSLQGGRLEVESAPGRGAVFRILLAVAPASA